MSKAYEGFGKNSGPSLPITTLHSRISFGPNNYNPFPSSPIITSTTPSPSSIESHGSTDGQNLGAQPTESPISVATFIASGGSTTGITAKDEKEVIESSS